MNMLSGCVMSMNGGAQMKRNTRVKRESNVYKGED